MRIAIVIATLGRAEVLRLAIDRLARQSRAADRIVVCAVTPADTVGLGEAAVEIEIVYGPKGSCAQRNQGLRLVGRDVDVVLFLDDDFLLADDYLEQLAAMFEADPSLAGTEGRVIADGATNAGYTFEEGVRLLAEDRRPAPDMRLREALYGCNMACRTSAIEGMAFDEHLPLYGWLEDVDFSYRLGKQAKLVSSNQLTGVHLATKRGRTSGVRFGYSQIANPLYLWRKGSIPTSLAFEQMVRNVASNLVRSVRPEPYVDRRGRLRGNLRGFRDLLTARLDPERILTMN